MVRSSDAVRCERVPSDTRERLDEPRQRCFTKLFQISQCGKKLEGYTYGHYGLRRDGAPNKAHCRNCCEKRRGDGTTAYYHVGSRSGTLKEVFPFGPKEDSAKKNEAAKRLLEDARRERPRLKLLEDGLAWTFSRSRICVGSETRRP